MFDWLKGARGRTRRRSGSSGSKVRGGGVRIRNPVDDRDPHSKTRLMRGNSDEHPDPPPEPPQPDPPPPEPPKQLEDSVDDTYYPPGESATGDPVGVLIVKEGVARGEIYKVFDGENTIGRGTAMRIRTDHRDHSVSREHSIIFHEKGNFGIKPCKEGENPTVLNDNEVSGGAPLLDGDIIRIGKTTLKFRVS